MNQPIRQRGFTLIEVMIVVAIIGILAAVALPAYQDYVRRGQLPEATSRLSEFRIRMEQYYQDHRNYGANACADAATGDWAEFKPKDAVHFGFGCELSDAGQGYVITATGNKAAAQGHTYTINDDNLRRTTAFKGKPVSKDCWLYRGEEC